MAELAGRSLTHRLNVGRHVGSRYASADYYPFLLAGVKVALALLLARLAWRFVKARSAAQAGQRLLEAVGVRPTRAAPRFRLQLSPRLWFAAFAVTSLFSLIQTDAERLSAGQWSLLDPWLHTSALPVFAVLAVLFALVWSAVAHWLREYEQYAQATAAHARCVTSPAREPAPVRARDARIAPRRLFGLVFESRPPPLIA